MSSVDRLTQAMDGDGEIPFSEDDLASRFSADHGDDLRYVDEWSCWLEWDGEQWRRDKVGRVFQSVRLHCRAIAARCGEGGRGMVRAASIGAVERLAGKDERQAVTADVWDLDLFVLNIEKGAINLGTGEHYAPRRADYCTKIAPVLYDAEATCPMWDKFLGRVTDGDKDLQKYLARICGYWLTGDTGEHALFFLFGTGSNGKNTFFETISGILGDYATTAPMGTFLSTKWDRHPTEIAGLHGVRLVVADEVEAGRHWNEARIKQLTGGGKVKARFMRRDFFEFSPQFKILVVGNHKPSLRTVDEAIRRRLHMIPFTVRITPEERILGLKRELEAEWPGILNWCLAGCKAWQEGGLRPPKAVRDATDTYLAEEDIIQCWIRDGDHAQAEARTKSSILFMSFCGWCEVNKEHPGTAKSFSQRLAAHGYRRQEERKGTYFYGLKL